MSDETWRGLLRVLGTVLSPGGLRKVETIMSLEREVRELDGGLVGWAMRFLRDERRYYLALFGEPTPISPWGLRFDGHHVSLNWTVVPGGMPSVTPLFLGSQPREVPAGMVRAGLRALPEEEDRARALWLSLDPAQRESASLPFEVTTSAFGDRALFIGAGERVDPGAPAGLSRAEMAAPQQALLDALIEVYVGNFSPEIAAARRATIEAGDPEAIHFAWAGGDRPGEPSYHRVQGGSFLIEFDNSLEDADHVHAVWREFSGDFGRDLLAEHHAHAHRGTD